jgi:MFS family permease
MMVTFHGMWSIGALIGGGIGALAIRLNVSIHIQYWAMSLVIIPIIIYSSSRFLASTVDQKAQGDKKRKGTPPIIWMLGCMGLCASLGEGAAADWGGILAKENFHSTIFQATLPYILFMSGMIFGRMFGDKLAERLGVKLLLMLSGALFAAGYTAGVVIGTTLAEIIAWCFIGMGVSAVIPIVVSTTGSIILREYSDIISPSEAVALVTAINYSGFFFGPPLMGFLADQITLRWAMLLPAILGLLLLFFSRKVIKF